MDTVKSLQILCAQAGTNITEVCKRAGVNRNTVDQWRKKEPKQFQTLRALFYTIEKIKQENNATTALPGESSQLDS